MFAGAAPEDIVVTKASDTLTIGIIRIATEKDNGVKGVVMVLVYV